MNKVLRRFLALALVTIAPVTHAAINPPVPSKLPVTAKELQQGYRDNIVLARPHAARRGSVDADESREGLRVREKFARFRDLRVIELAAGDSADDAIRRLRASGRYEFVEPDYLVYPAAEPNDPDFTSGRLWALRNTGQSAGVVGADIKATAAWDIIREAPNVVVAVIDTGVNINHQDIIPNLWRNPNPTFGDIHGARFLAGTRTGDPTDDNGHGTHVAGTIGAAGNNGLAITGIAWRVQIMAVKVLPAEGPGSNSDIVSGINYAVQNGAHIINASFGALVANSFSQAELAAITAARDAGVIFVAAAGNSATNMDVSRFYPASHALDNIVSVGNSTRRDELSLSTNYGAAVDLFAPGSEIVSLSSTGNTETFSASGTSMAAPHVAGALALLKARFPTDTYRQLINRLLRSTDAGERFAGRSQTGGRLNLLAALTSESNQPFNDSFARRPRFNGDNLSIRANNAGATAEAGEPAHAGAAPAASLWWEWVAPRGGLVTIDTAGSNYDTVVAIYSGNALGALSPVAANDDNAGNQTSRISFTAEAGVTYQIAVDGKNGASGLTLLRVGSTPANDAFATPVALTGQSTRVTATNANCSREPGESRILGLGAGTSLWYRWVAPRTGRFQVATVSDDFDPLLAVYTGEALDALTTVDANDNANGSSGHTGALCTIAATAGTTYRFAVDSKDVRTVGQFTLTITDSLWQTPAADAITGAPAIAPDGSVYFGSIDRSVHALNPDGTRKWSYPTGGLIDTCSPAIAPDGTVYIGSNDGHVYALRPDGTEKWKHPFRDNGGFLVPVSNSPAIGTDGTVYVKAGDGYLYALDPADGNQKWRFDVRAPESYGSPSIAPDGTIYQGSDNGRLYALRPDGTLKWSYQGENDIYTVPAIDAQGNVYFGVLVTGKLFSVAPDGTHRWTYAGATTGSSSAPCLSPDGNTVYFGGYDRKLHAIDTATGAARWTYLLNAQEPGGVEVRASSPAIDANGVIYLGCYDFKLYAINPNGTLRRTYDTGNWIRSSPAIFGTTLYVGSNDEKLYAFDLGAGAGGGPWPQYRQNPRRTGRHEVQRLALATAPQAQVAILGRSFTLSALATGDGPIQYQWLKDGAAISGATSATFVIPTVTAGTAGSYAVRVSNAQESITSPVVVIPVENALPGRLMNLSVRTTAGSGAQSLSLGFVVRGGASKPLLIRGVGPTLREFGVTGVLSDPQLQLRSRTSGLVVENDNWGGTATIASTAAAVGAFALPSGSLDAALLQTIPAGEYTVEVAGAGGAVGIALAELYDPEPTNAQTLVAVSRLVNVAARAQVGTGGELLIAGFTISGNVPKRVLIRGIGPGLTQFGVGGVLVNPRLELYRGTTKVNENDNWGGALAIAAAAEQVGAFRLANAGSNDSALLLELAPGSYTAQVSGVNDTTGVALVEVYEMP